MLFHCLFPSVLCISILSVICLTSNALRKSEFISRSENEDVVVQETKKDRTAANVASPVRLKLKILSG